MTLERRTIESDLAADGERRTVTGLAAVYESRTQLWDGFFEQIEAGAFAESLAAGDDVRALFNHDPNLILGRTRSGTLTLSSESTGLRYEFEAPETTVGNDLLVSLRRGDISQSSFAFEVVEANYENLGDGDWLRKIVRAKLWDVSPVTYPAYEDTTSEARGARLAGALRGAPSEVRAAFREGGASSGDRRESDSGERTGAPIQLLRDKLRLVEAVR